MGSTLELRYGEYSMNLWFLLRDRKQSVMVLYWV